MNPDPFEGVGVDAILNTKDRTVTYVFTDIPFTGAGEFFRELATPDGERTLYRATVSVLQRRGHISTTQANEFLRAV